MISSLFRILYWNCLIWIKDKDALRSWTLFIFTALYPAFSHHLDSHPHPRVTLKRSSYSEPLPIPQVLPFYVFFSPPLSLTVSFYFSVCSHAPSFWLFLSPHPTFCSLFFCSSSISTPTPMALSFMNFISSFLMEHSTFIYSS